VEGERVLVSPDVGPAVIGWFRGTVVLPEWALGLEPDWRRLVLAHEREHVRAHDPALLALGILALVLLPGNAALWWQVRRLRLAVELDCDERVLRAHPDVGAYGGLLLEGGRRASGAGALLAAMSEPRSFLKRRIRRMVNGWGPRRATEVVGLGVVSAGVLVMACNTPAPDRVVEADEPAGATVVEAVPESMITPFTVAPELKNREEVLQALEDAYPPLLRDAGIGGRTFVWLRIDETGTVRETRLKESSGHEALDQAALKVAERMRFTPALNRGERVAVWIALPIAFSTK
jgi:TonB family protein